jgi:hypothetical protein
MVYDPDIPQPKDDLSVSQGELLANFQGLNTQFSVNHVALDDTTADVGKHKFVTFVQQSSVPETKGDEYLIFSQDQAGTPELYARPESNGTAYQLTKGGSIYTGLLPVVAVNFNAAGTVQGTALNVASIARPGGTGRYVITFTNALPDNNYFWDVSGFDNSNNPVISQVTNTATYGSVVTTTSISVDFKNQNNTLITALTRACVVCWRVQ